jgi:hypothetical protein
MKRFRFALANLLIGVVLYANIAVMFGYPLSLVTSRVRLPINARLADFFNIFGVFGYYELVNRDFEMYGILASPAPPDEERVIKLDADAFFPFDRGETQSRIFVARHEFLDGSQGQHEAWKALAGKVRARYNRLHAEAPIRAVGIVHAAWPRTFEGYEAGRRDESLQYHLLFSE